ncbi:hypothetical protein [Flavobacterium sp. ov086]|uniref:hypothetical protein n=1 Tax=Flavobacterium sp. ov086 TaxID=1761785 RepID=UPI000B6641A0|nr:hypothetical protein [Flavobacterium sp. ov086]SNR72064.1 hypothetical protein SAMN04487979_11839 [Flavobacterium sp. ov086]
MSSRFLFLLFFLSFYNAAFSQTSKLQTVKKEAEAKTDQNNFVEILWLDKKGVLQINEDYIKTITNAQRAALGYITTNIGNDCYWDGEKKADESNLKCKFLSALNLGYQCSETHLSFLRQWFKKDPEVLKNLETCTKTASSDKIQDRFVGLRMSTTNNTIKIVYGAMGMDTETQKRWRWIEESIYSFTEKEIKQIKRKNLQGGFF